MVTCGNSTSEAQARVYVFDNLSDNWVHISCYDAEITAEQDAPGWKYYKDARGDVELDTKAVSISTEYEVWATIGEHYAHCALSIKKLRKALIDDALVKEIYMGYEHAQHYMEVLRKPCSNTTSSIIAVHWKPTFLTCRRAQSMIEDGLKSHGLKKYGQAS